MNTPIDTFTWHLSTAAAYHEALGDAPPAEQYRSAFLYGEAMDYRGEGGAQRFRAFRVSDGVYYVSSRPVTRAEFRTFTAAL